MDFFPQAKINLGLNVVARRDDGYHDLETVFWPVEGIRDHLTITASRSSGIHLQVDADDVMCPNDQNLVVKAYNLLREEFDLPGVDVKLSKEIPTQAGMGGGSSDGAYMIRALNKLFNIGLDNEWMRDFASRLGADCPFFIDASPAYATGIGDKLENLDKETATGIKYAGNIVGDTIERFPRKLLVVKPDVAVSTKVAYEGITPHKPKRNCRDVVMHEPMEKWRYLLVNDFEESIFQRLPELAELKQQIYEDGATYASMSGSGSALYGIFQKDIDIDLTHYAKYYYKIVTF